MTIESMEELAGLQRAGALVASTLNSMKDAVEPGMTTRELDGIGARLLEKAGARSAPALTYQFPGVTCISVNEEAAHGIPGRKTIRRGDLINIDVSCELDGFFADTGASFVFGHADARVQRLLKATRRALRDAMGQCRSGRPLNQIGRSIAKTARRTGHTVIENLSSHGVGRALHEEPKEIPSYYDPTDRRRMRKGMVFTIEPFLSTGARQVQTAADGWTLYTDRMYRTAQYEHTIVVNDDRPPTVITRNHWF